jgi:hypothetical protein
LSSSGAAAVRELSETEILVEAFGYRCVIDSDGSLRVSPPAPEVEMGIRLGYVDVHMQRHRLRA